MVTDQQGTHSSGNHRSSMRQSCSDNPVWDGDGDGDGDVNEGVGASVRALECFHPSLRAWFSASFSAPTEVQCASWPLIADGQHVLATAPTGSGKTLTAFLWALNQFATGACETGRTRVLYISPLKALNNDIQRNLLGPLAELRDHYHYPELRVQTRSGDTPQSERQRMLRRPPDILITTPESLSLLLTTTRGRQALGHINTVVLDEIHSIVGNRRGVQLMTSLERLVGLSGEFQRIALSATVRPLQRVADYVAGCTAEGAARQMAIVDSSTQKAIDFQVHLPEAARDAAKNGKKIWEPLADHFRTVIDGNRSTLFFTNSRRLAEKITLQINRDQLTPLAYAHHGSLSREIRGEVEQRMKAGELKAIVATNSLELGIDVGNLDEVVMVQSPPSVASALQRIGRAGHSVGEVSYGSLYPSHAQDFLEAAVLARGIEQRQLEPLKPLENALDVLAQIIISTTATDPWPLDELFDLLRRAAPYRHLPREHFDLVIDMLAGRYAGSRVRELKPRVTLDRVQQTVQANRSAVFALYTSGGTIPDRGYYQLRHSDTGVLLGELDEEFVWEAKVGQNFTLGTQSWQVQRITHNDVLVRAAKPGAAAPPFWRSEDFNRSVGLSLAIGEFLAFADNTLRTQGRAPLETDLCERRGFDTVAATELVDYLERQREATRGQLPHRHHLLLELVQTGPGGYRGPDNPRQLVLHTYWGGQLNRPWALALQAAWPRGDDSMPPEIHADNNAIVIQCQHDLDPHAILALVRPSNLETLLRASLEGSGVFGARFRECAGRSLLLNRHRFNQRLPLWMSRLQAKKLMSATRRYSDFPVLLETWRTCLEDEFDIDALSTMLVELETGAIDWSLVTTSSPSPFAASLTFGQVSRYMYADDTPETADPSGLRDDLIASAVRIEALRPRLDPAVVADYLAKRQRTAPGYEPTQADDWGEWLKERVLLPEAEWSAALRNCLVQFPELYIISVGERRWAAHRELVHGLYQSGFVPGRPPAVPMVEEPRDATQLAQEMLSFYGPLGEDAIAALLPSVPDYLLREGEALIHGRLLVDDEAGYWCDADNFESLLRFQRARRRSLLLARPATALPGFWADWQGLGAGVNAADDVVAAQLAQLRGFSAPVRLWLQELLPPRCAAADHRVDQIMQEEGLCWLGVAKEAMTLCFPEEAGLFAAEQAAVPAAAPETSRDSEQTVAETMHSYFRDPNARYTFFQIAEQAPQSLADFSVLWWEAVWRSGLNADSLAPLRQGLARGFTLAIADTHRNRRRRARGLARGWPGNWQLVHDVGSAADSETDALSELEDAKDRVRILLERYGVLCRETVNREWCWRDAFRALRLMELAGEVSAGYFFDGLSGPQFAAPRALQALSASTPPEHHWCSAQDPSSPCGLGLDWPELPQHRAGNYLSWYQGALALVVENNGRRLHYHVPPEHPQLDQINAPLEHIARLRQRGVIDTINGEPVAHSVYREGLARVVHVGHDHKQSYFERH